MRRRLRPGKGLSLSATHTLSLSSLGAERALLRAGRLRPPAVNTRTREALQASAEEGAAARPSVNLRTREAAAVGSVCEVTVAEPSHAALLVMEGRM